MATFTAHDFTFAAPKSTKAAKTTTFVLEENEDFVKQVTVRKWKQQPVVDIRLYEKEREKLVATKKGVMLYMPGWEQLLEVLTPLQEAYLSRNGEEKFWLQSVTDRDQPAHVFASIFVPEKSKNEALCQPL